MKSETVPSFWKTYNRLSNDIKKKARKSYQLWRENPFHPSLNFKCVNQEESVWSLRISRGYRALCVFDGDIAVWFWVGSHDGYEKLIQNIG